MMLSCIFFRHGHLPTPTLTGSFLCCTEAQICRCNAGHGEGPLLLMVRDHATNKAKVRYFPSPKDKYPHEQCATILSQPSSLGRRIRRAEVEESAAGRRPSENQIFRAPSSNSCLRECRPTGFGYCRADWNSGADNSMYSTFRCSEI